MVLMAVGKPTLQMTAFQVQEGVLMMLATNGLLRVKVYRNRDLLGLWRIAIDATAQALSC